MFFILKLIVKTAELLVRKGANVNVQNNQGRTPLHEAAIDGNSLQSTNKQI